MYISSKRQAEQIERVKGLTDTFKHHWDKVYTGPFPDYRRMANGELPSELANKLKGDEYKYHAKLIPRIVPVALEYLKTSIMNSLFNRERLFEFVGRVQEQDHNKAQKCYNLVSYSMDVTGAEEVCEEIVEDALEVGIGYGEIVHHRETAQSPAYTMENGIEVFDSENRETIYEGPSLKYLRTETVYPDNERSIKNITAYSKLMRVPISSLKREATPGGLYAKYAPNIRKIRENDFDGAEIESYDVQDDHTDAGKSVNPPDFPVLLNEFWVRMAYDRDPIETWYVITVANYNHNPQLIRFARDPMGTGKHPLIACRVYPKNNRLAGESVPEKLQNYLLEKWHKRNQRINLVNLAHDLAGMLITQQGVINRDSIYVRRNKIVKVSGNSRDVQNIPLDLSPLQTSVSEEAIIDKEVQEEIGTNPIALGSGPVRRETATAIATVDENARARANRPIRAVEKTLIKPLAKGFLLHCQLLMPEDIKLRILGPEGQYAFQTLTKRDILGVFDVRCKASSELLTKGIKQALYNNLAQIYLSPGSGVRMDKQEFAREHFRVSEWPNVDRVISPVTDEEMEADRENGALLNGVPWKVLEHEDHEHHIKIHVQALQEVQQSGGDTGALEMHIQQHVQMMQAMNGQVNLGKELPTATNRGDFQDTMNSNMTLGIQ